MSTAGMDSAHMGSQRWRARRRVQRRSLAVMLGLCLILFAAFFALGRLSNTTGPGLRQEIPAAIQFESVGALVPMRLSGVPPIRLVDSVKAKAPVSSISRGHSAGAEAVSVTPHAETPVLSAPRALTPGVQRAPSSSAPSVPSRSSGGRRSGGGGGGGQTGSKSAGETSFDSSG
jgi:hypothetical protein